MLSLSTIPLTSSALCIACGGYFNLVCIVLARDHHTMPVNTTRVDYIKGIVFFASCHVDTCNPQGWHFGPFMAKQSISKKCILRKAALKFTYLHFLLHWENIF